MKTTAPRDYTVLGTLLAAGLLLSVPPLTHFFHARTDSEASRSRPHTIPAHGTGSAVDLEGTRQAALRMALRELRRKRLLPTNECDVNQSRHDQGWSFWFVFLPAAPGLDVAVFVGDSGEAQVLPGF